MWSEAKLKRWIRSVRNGRTSGKQLVDELKRLPFEDLGFARLDTHRRLRRGVPEVVFCAGKREEHLVPIVQRLLKREELVLLTRLEPTVYARLAKHAPEIRYDPVARLGFYVGAAGRRTRRGLVGVVTGGTADWPVAEEAARTLELLGSRVERLYDVGVAGLHRLLSKWSVLQRAKVLIVIAGMEGALASVVSGLVSCPVVAVPTSVGYGASFEGLAALLAMLSSCSPGIGVVNIDNGFGAAYLAHLINAPVQSVKRHA